jgi:hypothetical protein
MATNAYVYASDIQMAFEKQNIIASEPQKLLIWAAINNYIFFLSQRGTPEDDVKVADTMPKLLEIITEMRNKPGEWHYLDTLAWANLHLRIHNAAETETIIQSLLNRNDIDRQWKVETKERYDFYNLVQLHAGAGVGMDPVRLIVP